MLNWHKKEKPLQGIAGMGGGVVSRLLGATPTAFFVEYIVLAGGGGGGSDGSGGIVTGKQKMQ